MEEFYTAATYYAIAMAELEAEMETEKIYEAHLDAFDPYAEVEEDEENERDYDHLIDSYMEASLFGWDS